MYSNIERSKQRRFIMYKCFETFSEFLNCKSSKMLSQLDKMKIESE